MTVLWNHQSQRRMLPIMILAACLGMAHAAFCPTQSSCSMSSGCSYSIKRQQFYNLRPTFIMTAHSMTAKEEDIDFLFEENDNEDEPKAPPALVLDAQERVWRYANKPLLRIGTKGATLTHGNSLKNLLKDHVVVKVKVNTKKFGTLEKAFTTLRELAVENGAPADIEMIQMRDFDKTIVFGMPGTLAKMETGDFPPPEPVVVEQEDGDGDEDSDEDSDDDE